MDIRVIGAGVMGLAVATELTERGHTVEVFERASTLGADASSWLAGGMLAPLCEGETAEEPVVRLGQQAADWWAARVPGVERRGTLVVAPARDTGELTRFAKRTLGGTWLDGQQIGALEPDLGGSFCKGLFYRDEAHLDPRIALAALKARLEAAGAGFNLGTAAEARGLTVDCRGWAAREVLSDLRGVRGEMLVLRTEEISLGRPVRLLHPRLPVYVVPRGHGLFMIGATMIESGERRQPSARSIAGLINSAYALDPRFGEAEIVEIGADLRPAFPDNLPRIRWRGGTMYLNGLYRHGFLLAPALARMAAAAIEDPTHIPELMDEDHRERATA